MDGVVPDMSMSSVRSSLTARTGKPPPAALSKEMLYRFHERLTLSVLEDMWFDIKQLLIKDPSADGKISRNDLVRFGVSVLAREKHGAYHLSEEEKTVIDRIFSRIDCWHENLLTATDVITSLILLCNASPLDKLKSLFRVFDADDDSCLTPDEIFEMYLAIQSNDTSKDPTLQSADLLFDNELALQQAKRMFLLTVDIMQGLSDFVTFEEFRKSCEAFPALMQMLLPGRFSLAWILEHSRPPMLTVDGPNARAERDQARAFVKEALRGPDNKVVRLDIQQGRGVRLLQYAMNPSSKEPLVTAEQEREREKEKEREREKEKERERERERENGGRSKSRQPTAAGRRTGPAGASASASASSKLPAAEPGGPSSQSRAVSRMSKHPKDHSGAPPPTAASGKRTAPPTRGGSGGVPSGKAASRPPAASPMPLGKAFASAEGKKTGQGTAAALQAALHSQTPSAPLEQNLSTAQSLTQTQEGETAGDGHGGDLKDIKEKEKEGEKEKENHEGGGQRPGTPQSVHTETAAGKERTDPGGAKGERESEDEDAEVQKEAERMRKALEKKRRSYDPSHVTNIEIYPTETVNHRHSFLFRMMQGDKAGLLGRTQIPKRVFKYSCMVCDLSHDLELMQKRDRP